MFGTSWGYGASAADSREILLAYLGAGGNFIDTADCYQSGESEEIIGQLLRGMRNDVVLATKCGRSVSKDSTLSRVGASRKSMVQAVEASLRRLQTDRVDIFFVHMDDLFTPMEEIARGFDDLVRTGKVLYPGLSNFPAWRVAHVVTLADWRGWAPVSSIQVEYSLLQRSTESEVLPMAAGLGLGVMAYSPLGGGLLSLKYGRAGERGRATDLPESVLYYKRDNQRIYDALERVAAQIKVPPAQVAAAWVRTRGSIPIAGPRTMAQLDDYLASAELRLEKEQLDDLDQASRVELSYPNELIRAAGQRHAMTSGYADRIDQPGREVA
jgi:aryl-alcohol dehydrogenase-like predicted oxidoreductase